MSGSIFKEVTFTPQSFDKEYIFANHRRFGKLIAILESLISSGIIVAVSDTWKDDVYNFIDKYDDVDKSEIINLLEMLSKRDRVSSYPNHKALIDEALWIIEIDKLNKQRRFDFAAGTTDNGTVKTLENIKPKTYLNSGAKIQKQTIENIKKILDPILTYAEIVKIYDPYFMIEKDRFFNVLKVICERLGKSYGDENDAFIDIHTSVKSVLNNKGEFDWRKADSWIGKIRQLEKTYNHTITLKIWEDTDKNKWHDRWIITNQCGVSMGKGSDASDWTDATWGLLDWEELPKIEDKFTEGKKLYHYIGKVTSEKIHKEQNPKNVEINMTDEEREQYIQKQSDEHKKQAEEAEKIRQEKLKQPKKLGRRLVPLSERKKEK